MPRDTAIQERKRRSIVNFFRDLDGEQEFGAKKYTTAYCLSKTAHHFFLTPRSIERYIYG